MFESVLGQEHIKQQLTQQVEAGRVPHALLFCGTPGSGQMPMALELASALLGGGAMVQHFVHPDLHFVFPVVNSGEASKTLSDTYIDKWREMLTESIYFDLPEWQERIGAEKKQTFISVAESNAILQKLSLRASQGGYKVMIIWLPELMKQEAANKLLKILEEPTPRTVFILVSDHAERLLPTILSRTQRVEFRPLSVAEMSEALQTRNALQSADASRIARQVGGNYVRALRQIHIDEDAEEFFDLFVQLMRLCYMRKIKDLYQWAETIASWKRERQKHFLEYCQRLVRENFVFNFGRPELNSLSQREADFSRNFARFVNERNVMGIMNELSLAQRDIAQNVSARMVFFDLAIKMIMLLLK